MFSLFVISLTSACDVCIPKLTDHFETNTFSDVLRICPSKLILVTNKIEANVSLRVFMQSSTQGHVQPLSSFMEILFNPTSFENYSKLTDWKESSARNFTA
jgi:hypothetical protein